MQTNGWGVQMPFWRRVMSPTARGIWFFNSNTRANRTKQNLKTKIKNNNKNKKTIIKNWEACFFLCFLVPFCFCCWFFPVVLFFWGICLWLCFRFSFAKIYFLCSSRCHKHSVCSCPKNLDASKWLQDDTKKSHRYIALCVTKNSGYFEWIWQVRCGHQWSCAPLFSQPN